MRRTALLCHSVLQEHRRNDDDKRELRGNRRGRVGRAAHKAVVGIGAVGPERHKADGRPRHLLRDPSLELRYSGVNFRETGPGTRYSEAGDARLDPV